MGAPVVGKKRSYGFHQPGDHHAFRVQWVIVETAAVGFPAAGGADVAGGAIVAGLHPVAVLYVLFLEIRVREGHGFARTRGRRYESRIDF